MRACGSSNSANFYGPRSGGLRTALHHLGDGYAARGHTVCLVVPGPRHETALLPGGVQRITLPTPRVPGTGGYRLLDPHRVERLLAELDPDHLRGVRPAHAARARPVGPPAAACPAR